ncbi:hypothetical protein AAMO2058_000767600 [Amorphochlora amoebiformis]
MSTTTQLQEDINGLNDAVDAAFVLLSAFMVFLMQLGFGLVETGSISSINTQSIILKNLLDVSFVTIGWWFIGYSLSSNTGNYFSGDGSKVFSTFEDGWLRGQFNLSFAAAAATILSGAVAGRIKFLPYCIVSCTIGTIIFPIVAHWAWASNGWLYKSGFIDFAGTWRVAVVAAFNSSIAPAAAIITILILQNILEGKMSIAGILNSALAGLVVVTPGCATLEPWAAIICGILAAVSYQGSSYSMVKLLLDDPVDAVSVHGVCGLLGVILAGVLSDEALIDRAYGSGYRCSNRGKQLGVQIIGCLAIIAWSAGIIGAIFLIFRLIPGGLRVSKQDELVGTDFAYFSGYAYPDFKEKVREAKEQHLRKIELARRMELKKSKKSSAKSRQKTDSGIYKGSMVPPIEKDHEKDHEKDREAVSSPHRRSLADAHSGGQRSSLGVEAKYQDIPSKSGTPYSPSSIRATQNNNKPLIEKIKESELEQKALREQIDSLQSAVASLMERRLGLPSALTSERDSTGQVSSQDHLSFRVNA